MWSRLAEIRIECGPRWEKIFQFVGVGVAAMTSAAATTAVLPVLPALAVAGIAGSAGAWFAARATATQMGPTDQPQLNHDLMRAFRRMVLTRLDPRLHNEDERRWLENGTGPTLPTGVTESMGPGLAGLLAHIGTLQPADSAPIPAVPWGDEVEWRRFLLALDPAAAERATEFHQHGLFWFLWEVRHDDAATAALQQYVAAAILSELKQLREESSAAQDILNGLGVSLDELKSQAETNHQAILARFDGVESLLTGFKSVGRLLEKAADVIPDRIRTMEKGPTWRDVEAGYVFERRLVGPLRECLQGSGERIFAISAPSGAGKSTFLMWAAMWCHRDFGLPTFYCPDAAGAMISDQLPRNAILVMDHFSRSDIKKLLESLHKAGFEGVLIVADQDVCWQSREMRALAEDPSLYEQTVHQLGGLDDHEKRRLRGLLDASKSEHWAGLSEREKVEVLESPSHGELLVILIQAITGQNLLQHVTGEMTNLKESCEREEIPWEPVRTAILTVAWPGLGDQACPEEWIRAVAPDFNFDWLSLVESILLPRTIGHRLIWEPGPKKVEEVSVRGFALRHRLFAEAILNWGVLHRKSALEKLLRLDPDMPLLAATWIRSNSKASFQLLELVITKDGPHAWLWLEEAAMAAPLFSAGVQILGRILDRAGNHEQVLVAVADSLRRIGREGIAILDRTVELGGNNAEVLSACALAAGVMGRDGVPCLGRILLSAGNEWQVLKNVALACGFIGEEALPILRQAYQQGHRDCNLLVYAASSSITKDESGLPVVWFALENCGHDKYFLLHFLRWGLPGGQEAVVVPILQRVLELDGCDRDVIELLVHAAADVGGQGILILEQVLNERAGVLSHVAWAAVRIGANAIWILQWAFLQSGMEPTVLEYARREAAQMGEEGAMILQEIEYLQALPPPPPTFPWN